MIISRCEDAEMKLSFAEAKLEEIDVLKLELKNAHQRNQDLRDDIVLVVLMFISLIVPCD